MQCPKCEACLEPNTFGDQTLLECTACAGMWLRYGQLPSLLIALAEGRIAPRAGQASSEAASGLVKNWDQELGYCPLCQPPTIMVPSYRNIGSRVLIDYCQRGHGLWLDAGEIRNIQSRLYQKVGACEDMLRRLLTPLEEAA